MRRVTIPRRGLRRCACVALVCWACHLSIAGHAQSPEQRDRVLTSVGNDDVVFFVSPKPGEERIRTLLALIARSARVAIGFEEVAGGSMPFDGNLAKIPSSDRTDIIGLTVGEALDALVAADPRYRWHEQDGVFVIRPVEAWADPVDFLHRGFAGFRLVDGTASDAAREIYERFGVAMMFGEGGVIGNSSAANTDVRKLMTFEVPAGSILDALNSIVRTHGGIGWVVRYARGPAEMKNSCIQFVTFDSRFTGIGAAPCDGVAFR
jgi:hypothetical protein